MSGLTRVYAVGYVPVLGGCDGHVHHLLIPLSEIESGIEIHRTISVAKMIVVGIVVIVIDRCRGTAIPTGVVVGDA